MKKLTHEEVKKYVEEIGKGTMSKDAHQPIHVVGPREETVSIPRITSKGNVDRDLYRRDLPDGKWEEASPPVKTSHSKP